MTQNVQAEYGKLKGLMESIIKESKRMQQGSDVLLHEAEMSIAASSKPDVMRNLENNLRSMRSAVLDQLQGIIKKFG